MKKLIGRLLALVLLTLSLIIWLLAIYLMFQE